MFQGLDLGHSGQKGHWRRSNESNSENQNCLNKGRWFYSRGLGILLWGSSDDLAPSLPTWGTKLLLWEDPVGPALTKPHDAVLARAQKTGKWCVIISSFLLWALQEEFSRTSTHGHYYCLLVALLKGLLFTPQIPKSCLPVIEIREKSSWQLRPLWDNPSHSQRTLPLFMQLSLLFLALMTSVCAPKIPISSKKTLCKFHSHRHFCDRFVLHEIAEKEICIWMASLPCGKFAKSHRFSVWLYQLVLVKKHIVSLCLVHFLA